MSDKLQLVFLILEFLLYALRIFHYGFELIFDGLGAIIEYFLISDETLAFV